MGNKNGAVGSVMLVLGNVDSVRDHFTSRKQYEGAVALRQSLYLRYTTPPSISPAFAPQAFPWRGRCHEVTDEVERLTVTFHVGGKPFCSSDGQKKTAGFSRLFHSLHLISRLSAPASPPGEALQVQAASRRTP